MTKRREPDEAFEQRRYDLDWVRIGAFVLRRRLHDELGWIEDSERFAAAVERWLAQL